MLVAGGFFGSFPGQPAPKGLSALDLVLAAGWGVAGVPTGSIQPDSGAGLQDGLIGLVNEGRPRQPTDWGALALVLGHEPRPHLQTDKAVNPKAIGIEGHSRWGKTALLAGALDPRVAIVYASCSGSLGASLEKRSYGEAIDNVASAGEYYWMAGNFLKYGGSSSVAPTTAGPTRRGSFWPAWPLARFTSCWARGACLLTPGPRPMWRWPTVTWPSDCTRAATRTHWIGRLFWRLRAGILTLPLPPSVLPPQR